MMGVKRWMKGGRDGQGEQRQREYDVGCMDVWNKEREEREQTGSAKNVICLRAPMGIFTWWICDELPKRVLMRMPLPSGRKPLKAQWRVFCSVAGSRTVRGREGGWATRCERGGMRTSGGE
jgi:hypothetical protein